MMRESRDRERKRTEELRVFLANTRSGVLALEEEPYLERIEGLLGDLDQFLGGELAMPQEFASRSAFSMGDYRAHILSLLGTNAMLFSDMQPLLEDSRKDKIWRFVTLVFMAQEREVILTQYGNNILVEGKCNEAFCEG